MMNTLSKIKPLLFSLITAFTAVFTLFAVTQADEIPLSPTQTIENNIANTQHIAIADIDNDGDSDVVGSIATGTTILWWENITTDASIWVSHTITAVYTDITDLDVADIDRDGDIDVTAVSASSNSLLWWENRLRQGQAWQVYTLTTNLDGAATVHIADIDDNGAVDLLTTASISDVVIWYQNPLTVNRDLEQSNNIQYITNTVYTPSLWMPHVITNSFNGVNMATAVDLDKDGDLEVVAASRSEGELIRWQNINRENNQWQSYGPGWGTSGIVDLTTADLDGNSHQDIIIAIETSNDIRWFGNEGDGSWTGATIELNFQNVASIATIDADLDGDIDVLAAGDDGSAWFDNINGDASYCLLV